MGVLRSILFLCLFLFFKIKIKNSSKVQQNPVIINQLKPKIEEYMNRVEYLQKILQKQNKLPE